MWSTNSSDQRSLPRFLDEWQELWLVELVSSTSQLVRSRLRDACQISSRGRGVGSEAANIIVPWARSTVSIRNLSSSFDTSSSGLPVEFPAPRCLVEQCKVRAGLAHRRSRFKWTWLLALSPAEFPRTRRARGFSGRGPRESIDRVWQCKLREAVPARTRARCPD